MRDAAGTVAVTAAEGARPARFATYAWGVLAFNLFVILWGAFVRATGSGAGCGNHWPLCNGEVVPRAPALQTLIEFGHRLTSGLALLLIAGLLAGAWRSYPRGHIVRRGAAWSAIFIVSEALIGAGLVLLEYVAQDASAARGWWVGGHLTNTFFLVAALALTAWWASGGAAPQPRGQGAVGALLYAALAGVLVLGVSGAITALGDTLFPVATLAEGKAMTFSPTAHVFVRLRIWHPMLAIAVGALVTVAALAAVRRPRPQVRAFAAAVVALWFVQLALGLLNVYLLAPVPVQLAHLLLSDLIWISLVLLTAATLAAPLKVPPFEKAG
ncbi:MAG: COX15/CtaA family protein [Deltaproteobacteria bacterium]|nr:COX15/CtaA family protein [Deltaproteobacteria bacterium]